MKNKLLQGVLITCGMSLLISCNSMKQEPAVVTIDKEEIKKIIQAKEDDFAAIYNGGELKNIGYYADDAVTYYQNRAPIKTREERLEFLKTDLGTNSNKISFTTNEIFVANDGNHVVEIGSYSVVDSTNTPINTGNYMSLFEKRDGNYFCIRDMSASDMPLEY
jgi:ketosteroid isomerase-like protein